MKWYAPKTCFCGHTIKHLCNSIESILSSNASSIVDKLKLHSFRIIPIYLERGLKSIFSLYSLFGQFLAQVAVRILS